MHFSVLGKAFPVKYQNIFSNFSIFKNQCWCYFTHQIVLRSKNRKFWIFMPFEVKTHCPWMMMGVPWKHWGFLCSLVAFAGCTTEHLSLCQTTAGLQTSKSSVIFNFKFWYVFVFIYFYFFKVVCVSFITGLCRCPEQLWSHREALLWSFFLSELTWHSCCWTF